jgi:hypothetical protein
MKEWGIPDFPSDNECYSCGHSLIPHNAKFVGIQEVEPNPDEKSPYDRFLFICPICTQVQLLANKEYLHSEKDTPNCHKPIKRMFMVRLDKIHISAYEVLDQDPWLKMLQDSKENPVIQDISSKEVTPK